MIMGLSDLPVNYRFFNDRTEDTFEGESFGDKYKYTRTLMFENSLRNYVLEPSYSPTRGLPEINYFYESEDHLKHLIENKFYKKTTYTPATRLVSMTAGPPMREEELVSERASEFEKITKFYYVDTGKLKKLIFRIKGQLTREMIIHSKETAFSSEKEIVILDGAGQPNFYVYHIIKVDRNLNKVFQSQKVINPINGKTIDHDSFEYSIKNSIGKISKYDSSKRAPVLFCDSGIDFISGKNVLVGPYAQSSIYGWFENADNLSQGMSGA